MGKYIIAVTTDDELITIEIIDANSWKAAVIAHSLTCVEDVYELSDDLTTAKREVVGSGWEFGVLKLEKGE